MAEASRAEFTVTLGRSGQVVKRAGNGLDGSFTDHYPAAVCKRSVKDRLGSNVDSSGGFGRKRFRGDAKTSSTYDDIYLSKDDLRHKIKKKHIQRQSRNCQQNGVDLRNILSRPARPLRNITVTRERMPEPKNAGPSYWKLLDAKEEQYTGTRDRGQLLPQTRNSDQHREEYRSQNITHPREHMNEPRLGIPRVAEIENVRHNLPEPNRSSVMANAYGPRATNNTNKVDSGYKPYSPWTMEQLRRRSPDEALPTTRTLEQLRRRSPDEALPTTRGLAVAGRSDEELQRRYTARTYDDAKAISISRDTFDFSRPMTSSSGLTKTAPPVGSVRTLATLANPAPQVPQPGPLAQRSAYVQVDDNVTVDSFLRLLDLERYAIAFKAEEVDMYSLKRMTEEDLKEMGLPMGPRKKILLALQPRLRRQA